MFDLTQEINLDSKNYTLYRKLQIILYLTAIFLALYLAFLILFPHKFYTFSFLNPNSNKNSMVAPKLDNGLTPKAGLLETNNKLIFNTILVGDYSKAKINLSLANSSSQPTSLFVSARKSYQSFFYKEGRPIGFKDGTLLKNKNHYYIISHGQLRKFVNLDALTRLGYSQNSFQKVEDDEMKYNPIGKIITATDSYPDDTLFKINHDYYILNNHQLRKFSSEPSFSTQYTVNQAITKKADFLKNYPLSNIIVGFADGTLVSNAISVYIVSNGKIYPINNAQTFLSKGYQWNNLVPASEDELALYKKTSLFKISDPQPDGTIFKTDHSKYYLIKDAQKHLLPGVDIANSWLKKNSPVSVSEKSLTQTIDCNLKKEFLNHYSYSCEIPLDNFKKLFGFDYEFYLSSNQTIKINSINVNYTKDINLTNFKESIKGFLNSIIGKYVQNSTH